MLHSATAGIFSDAQIAGWRKVADAVHARGDHIFLQLWHVGRVTLQAVLPGHALPVGPAAIRPAGKTFAGDDFVTPRILDLSEIPGIVQQYVGGGDAKGYADYPALA